LELLREDKLIREAIRQMAVRTGTDPWGGQEHVLKGVSLVALLSACTRRQHSDANMDMIRDIAEAVPGEKD